MRLKIVFKTNHTAIPINYQYHLCAFVYKRLRHEDEDFASFLHDKGFKGFRLFTFSQLFFNNFTVKDDAIFVGEGSGCWYISSCSEDFIRNFFSSLVEAPTLEIEGNAFEITQIDILSQPDFKERMRFVMLSPLVVSTAVKKEEKLYHKYLLPSDPEFQQALKLNLLKKYEAFYGEKIEAELSIEPDWDYINKRTRITKLISIKDVKVKGTVFPFTAAGDPRLIKFGYEVGFGERNSLGFGMVEVVKEG